MCICADTGKQCAELVTKTASKGSWGDTKKRIGEEEEEKQMHSQFKIKAVKPQHNHFFHSPATLKWVKVIKPGINV